MIIINKNNYMYNIYIFLNKELNNTQFIHLKINIHNNMLQNIHK